MGKSIGANPGLSRRAIEQELEYWQRLGNVVDEKLCRVYGAVERNLQSYHQLLKDRSNGLREVRTNMLAHILCMLSSDPSCMSNKVCTAVACEGNVQSLLAIKVWKAAFTPTYA